MPPFARAWLAAALLAVLPGTSAPAEPDATREQAATLFVHVNVVPMDSERVLRDQRVEVRHGRIAQHLRRAVVFQHHERYMFRLDVGRNRHRARIAIPRLPGDAATTRQRQHGHRQPEGQF